MNDEEIFDLADDYGWQDDFGRWDFYPEGLVNFALALAEKEREACAKIADDFDPEQKMSNYGQVIASKIRARGET